MARGCSFESLLHRCAVLHILCCPNMIIYISTPLVGVPATTINCHPCHRRYRTHVLLRGPAVGCLAKEKFIIDAIENAVSAGAFRLTVDKCFKQAGADLLGVVQQ